MINLFTTPSMVFSVTHTIHEGYTLDASKGEMPPLAGGHLEIYSVTLIIAFETSKCEMSHNVTPANYQYDSIHQHK